MFANELFRMCAHHKYPHDASILADLRKPYELEQHQYLTKCIENGALAEMRYYDLVRNVARIKLCSPGGEHFTRTDAEAVIDAVIEQI